MMEVKREQPVYLLQQKNPTYTAYFSQFIAISLC